jgi:valyl-tRNA synthetase
MNCEGQDCGLEEHTKEQCAPGGEFHNYLSFSQADRWISSTMQRVEADVAKGFADYRLDNVAGSIYQFVWDEFCDWYLEIAKVQIQTGNDAQKRATRRTLIRTLEAILRLAHPVIPFMKVSPATRLPLFVVGDSAFMTGVAPVLKSLAKLSEVKVFDDQASWAAAAQSAPVAIVGEARLCLFMEVDLAAEKMRLQKEEARLTGEITKSETKLANEAFVNKVPPAVLEQERKRLADNQAALAKIREQLARLK